jgi:GT2 family glycosyltransferase
MAPRLSVIIPAYNHLDKVLRCLNAARDTTDPILTEVLVQDDSSTEYNIPLSLGSCCERTHFNLGFAGNCNQAARRAQGEVLFFLNQDCYATAPGWDVTLLAFFDEREKAGIVGPTLLFPDGKVQSVGGLFDAAGQPFHEALGYANPDWEPIARPRKMSWTTGAALAVRRGLWNMLGGFDTAYGRGYFEDVDLCVRAQLEGYEVWHLPAIRFIHEVASTGGSPSFAMNARLFKSRWVDTKVVQPDVPAVKVRFWV